MTEKKKLREQIASHPYWQEEPDEQDIVQPPVYQRQAVKEPRRREVVEAQRTLQRVVTIPDYDPSTAWNDFSHRQEQMRRARAKPNTYIKSAPRTYVRTGVRATSGRIKAVRPLVQQHTSPIPARSGRNASKRGFFWRLFGFLAGLIGLVLAANFAFSSNAFRIEQVSVVGTHNQVLINAIQRMGMQGQNIFLLDVNGLTAHIESYSRVETVSLSKNWPNQLTVNVTERTPVLLWQTGQGTYSVDNQGVVIAPLSETSGADHLTTIIDTRSMGKSTRNTGKTVAAIQPGTHLNTNEVAFALAILNRVPQLTGITSFKLRYDSATNAGSAGAMSNQSGSYTLESSAGWVAYLGGANDVNPLDNRLIELQAILTLAQQQQLALATVDVRYGLHPIYTIKNS